MPDAGAKPGLELYGSDLSQLVRLPVRTSPPGQARFIDLFQSMTAPGVFLGKFALLEMITELRYRTEASVLEI
jgi:hypothetical protein